MKLINALVCAVLGLVIGCLTIVFIQGRMLGNLKCRIEALEIMNIGNLESRIEALEIMNIELRMLVGSNKLLQIQTQRLVVPNERALKERIK